VVTAGGVENRAADAVCSVFFEAKHSAVFKRGACIYRSQHGFRKTCSFDGLDCHQRNVRVREAIPSRRPDGPFFHHKITPIDKSPVGYAGQHYPTTHRTA
jgi:hypothetical protein